MVVLEISHIIRVLFEWAKCSSSRLFTMQYACGSAVALFKGSYFYFVFFYKQWQHALISRVEKGEKIDMKCTQQWEKYGEALVVQRIHNKPHFSNSCHC